MSQEPQEIACPPLKQSHAFVVKRPLHELPTPPPRCTNSAQFVFVQRLSVKAYIDILRSMSGIRSSLMLNRKPPRQEPAAHPTGTPLICVSSDERLRKQPNFIGRMGKRYTINNLLNLANKKHADIYSTGRTAGVAATHCPPSRFVSPPPTLFGRRHRALRT